MSEEEDDVKVDARFEKWYKTIDLGDDGERIKARWKGIVYAFENIDEETIIPICQLAFGGLRPAANALTWFEESFKQFDESFVIGSNDSELRILAGMSIVYELENASYFGKDIYLAIAGASFSGLRTFSVPFDIHKMLQSTLHRISVEAATRPTGSTLDTEPLLFGTVVQQQWDTNRDAALKSMAASINAKLTPLYSKVEVLSTVLDVQDDELQVLWWLFGGRSQEKNCIFSKVPADCRPLIFGKELADCIKNAPGPASISDILAKAGVATSGRQQVLSAIASVAEWGLNISSETKMLSPWVHPLHYALSLQAQAQNGWQQYWASSVKVSVDAELSPLVLAQQFYRERLHLRSISDDEK